MAAPWTGGYRVRILGKLHGQDCVNVLHFSTNAQITDTPTGDALMLALLTAVLACVVEQLLPAVTSDYKLRGVEGTQLYTVLGDPVFMAADAGAQGALGPTSTSYIATLVHIKTGLGGKTHRGRVFLPPAGEAHTNDSLIDAPTLTQIAAFITCVAGKFIGQTASTDYRLGVLSRKILNGSFTNWNNGFTEASRMEANEVAAIMGSRKVGKGS